MQTETAIRTHLQQLGLPAAGITYVLAVHSSPPSRRVSNNVMLNGCLRVAFEEIGYALQSESVTGEGALLAELIYDKSNVLKIYDQPTAVRVIRLSKNDRLSRTTYTPEYLAVRKDKVVAYQYKTEEALKALVKSNEKDWIYRDGKYHDIPAETAYGELGIEHLVVSSTEFNPVRTENLYLLLQVRSQKVSKRQLRRSAKATSLLSKKGPMTLAVLASKLGLEDLTPILRWIVDGTLFVDITNSRLSDPEAAWIAAAPRDLQLVTAMTGSILPVGSYSDNLATTEVSIGENALIKWQRLAALGYPVPLPSNLHTLVRSPRTHRRWRKKLKDSGGDPNSLEDRTSQRGPPRGPKGWRLSKAHERLIRRAIKQFYDTPKASRPAAAFRQYLRMFEESKSRQLGSRPVDIKTFKSRLRNMDLVQAAESRGGKRAAHAAEPPVDPSLRSLRAKRAWQCAHIDHYLCDSYVLVMATNHAKYRLKPWVTVMRDEATGKVLAFSLCLSSPSRRSVAGVLRDCVRRHGCLPERMIVDNGPEFRSVYFEAFLASYAVTKQETPAGAPRFHGELERVFGITKEELLSCLEGSSFNDAAGRAASTSHKASRRSNLELLQLFQALERYFLKQFNAFPRGDALLSPDKQFEESARRFAFSGMKVAYDVAFLIRTGIPCTKGSYRIDPSRGVRVTGQRFYRHPAFALTSNTHVEGPVLEPWDDNIAYIPLDGKWLVAYHSSKYESTSVNGFARIAETSKVNDARAKEASKEGRRYRSRKIGL
ncbi:MAG TPA: hypothetical protein VGH91_05790 [Gammaproteobacteria bacterium]|jgi:transposase InsO family protein